MGSWRLSAIRGAWRGIWSDPRRRRAVAACAVGLLSAFLLARGLKGGGVLDGKRSNDSAAYRAAAIAALQGDLVPAYSAPRPYQYPPALAVLAAPLGLLPERWFAAAWTAGSLALLLWAFRRLREALGPPAGNADVLLGIFLVFRMLESDFATGNANSLVAALAILGYSSARRGREALGGGLLGLAAAVKVTPLYLALWLLPRRRWAMARGFVLGLLLAGALFPILVLGPGQYWRSLEAFYGSILRPMDVTGEGYSGEAPGGYLPGQSLRALLHRLLRPIDATAHDAALVAVNLAEIPKGLVDVLYVAAGLGITGLLLWRFRGGEKAFQAGEIGAAMAAMVLLSPLSRKAHFAALLPAAAAGFAAARGAPPGRRRKLLLALWWSAFALSELTTPAVLGKTMAAQVLAYCPLAAAAGLLIVLCLSRPGQERAPAAVER